MDSREQYFGAETIYFSNNEMISSIKLFDGTVEIIGIVDDIGDVQIVGKDEKRVFKFCLKNDTERKIQIKVWDEEIKRILPHIRSNFIIHLDGVAARPIKPQFNKGTENFELVIQSNTVINCFGIYQLEQLENGNTELPLFDLGNAGEAIGTIRIQGFVKTSFSKVNDERTGRFQFIVGSITDGTYKLEIRIKREDGQIIAQKGEKIQCKGVMKFEGTTFLNVETSRDILQIPGEKMSLKRLLRVAEKVEKVVAANEDLNRIKKLKN